MDNKHESIVIMMIAAVLAALVFVVITFTVIHAATFPLSEPYCQTFNDTKNNTETPPSWCEHNQTGWHYNKSAPVVLEGVVS